MVYAAALHISKPDPAIASQCFVPFLHASVQVKDLSKGMQHMQRLLYLTQPTNCMSNAIHVYRAMHKAALHSPECHSGADWSIFNTAGTWPRTARARLYGSNDMATGRPSLLSMACGLLMYPVYVAQVQQQLHAESNEAYVHVVFKTQFIHTHMSPQIWWWVCQNTVFQYAHCSYDCSKSKSFQLLTCLCTKHEHLPAYVGTLISSCQTCYKK